MMHATQNRARLLIVSLLSLFVSALSGGCGMGQPLYRPPELALRGDRDGAIGPLNLGAFEEPSFLARAAREASSQPGGTTVDPRATATRPARPTYTTPSASIQAMTFLAAAVGATEGLDTVSGGREISQGSVMPGVVSRPELQSSLGPTIGMSVGRNGTSNAPGPLLAPSVGRRGLQIGAPLGGGLTGNIFTPRSNPIGPRCAELVRAGFFQDSAACRAAVSR